MIQFNLFMRKYVYMAGSKCVTNFYSLSRPNYFKSIFLLNGQNYLIDDVNAGFNKNTPKNLISNSVF
jgi:hypothetical protein